MLVVKEKEVSKLTDQLQALQEEGQKDSAAVEAAEQHFRAVSAGLSTNEDGEEATLAGQMMTCKNDMSKADTEAKQVRKGLKHYQLFMVPRSSVYSHDRNVCSMVYNIQNVISPLFMKLLSITKIFHFCSVILQI